MMPVMDAFGFQSSLEERSRRVPPLILLSAAPGLSSAASQLRAVAVVPKPFHLHDLLEEVHRVVQPMNGKAPVNSYQVPSPSMSVDLPNAPRATLVSWLVLILLGGCVVAALGILAMRSG